MLLMRYAMGDLRKMKQFVASFLDTPVCPYEDPGRLLTLNSPVTQAAIVCWLNVKL